MDEAKGPAASACCCSRNTGSTQTRNARRATTLCSAPALAAAHLCVDSLHQLRRKFGISVSDTHLHRKGPSGAKRQTNDTRGSLKETSAQVHCSSLEQGLHIGKPSHGQSQQYPHELDHNFRSLLRNLPTVVCVSINR